MVVFTVSSSINIPNQISTQINVSHSPNTQLAMPGHLVEKNRLFAHTEQPHYTQYKSEQVWHYIHTLTDAVNNKFYKAVMSKLVSY